jgi:hypothetical protein
MSGAAIMIGTAQFPKPPTIVGITKKKIMMNACAVTITLYSWWFPRRKAFEGDDNSRRMRTLSRVPQTPENAPNRKYKELMSLWLVEKNQRLTKLETEEMVVGTAIVLEIFA